MKIKPGIYSALNGILFYIGWVLIVTNAALNAPWKGLFGASAIIALHLIAVKKKKKEALLILFATLCGFLIETALLKFDILRYASPNTFAPGYPPIWILCLYALFATTINHSLKWLQYSYLISGIFGAIGAVASYSAGRYLLAVEFIRPTNKCLLAIVIAWFFLTPLLYFINGFLSKHLDKTETTS